MHLVRYGLNFRRDYWIGEVVEKRRKNVIFTRPAGKNVKLEYSVFAQPFFLTFPKVVRVGYLNIS